MRRSALSSREFPFRRGEFDVTTALSVDPLSRLDLPGVLDVACSSSGELAASADTLVACGPRLGGVRRPGKRPEGSPDAAYACRAGPLLERSRRHTRSCCTSPPPCRPRSRAISTRCGACRDRCRRFGSLDDVPPSSTAVVIVKNIPAAEHGFHLGSTGQPLALIQYGDDWWVARQPRADRAAVRPLGETHGRGPSLHAQQGEVDYLLEISDPASTSPTRSTASTCRTSSRPTTTARPRSRVGATASRARSGCPVSCSRAGTSAGSRARRRHRDLPGVRSGRRLGPAAAGGCRRARDQAAEGRAGGSDVHRARWSTRARPTRARASATGPEPATEAALRTSSPARRSGTTANRCTPRLS